MKKFKTEFSHKERRYIVEDEGQIVHILAALSSHHPVQEYHIHTTYLDTENRTWSRYSKGIKAEDKLRLRSYNHDFENRWFEVKHREPNGQVTKRRQPFVPERDGWIERMLVPVAEVHYDRQAYEWRGLRVTIDRNLHSATDETPLNFWIVEIKTKNKVPKWFQPYVPTQLDEEWSKSKWSLSVIDFKSRMKRRLGQESE